MQKLKILNSCKYVLERVIRTRVEVGRRLRLQENCSGPGNEVGDVLAGAIALHVHLHMEDPMGLAAMIKCVQKFRMTITNSIFFSNGYSML